MQAASLRAAGRLSRTVRAAAALGALVGLAACGSFGNSSVQGAQPLACDDGLKAAFKPDANTSVVRVKAFRKGDPLTLENTVAAVAPATQVVAPACRRRSKSEPPCRSNIEPGAQASVLVAGCG